MILSILTLYNFDNSIFDSLQKYIPSPNNFPSEYEHANLQPIDVKQVITKICADCSDMELLYPDIEVMRVMIDNWGYINKLPWQLLYNTMFYKYNPIWNKDGKITKKETEDRRLTSSGSSDVNGSQEFSGKTTGSEEENGNSNSNTSSNTSVSAFNSSDFSPRDSRVDESTADNVVNRNSSSDNNSNVVSSDSSSFNNVDAGNITRTYEDVEKGNIGVTTTQKMLSEEREIAVFNIIDTIVESFKKEFCLMLY